MSGQIVAGFFALITLVVIGIIVAGLVSKPQGTAQLFTSSIGSQGLGSYLTTLANAQNASPGSL